MAYPVKNICVYCGSNVGTNQAYAENAVALGKLMASQGIGLVYGGGMIGLMGIIANAVLENGGQVVGIIPHALNTVERRHTGLTESIVVDSMHERKALMADRADAFVALPGGYGTFDEFFEIVTWSQLGIHPKPIVLFNMAGYYDALIAFVDQCVTEGFIRANNRNLFKVGTTPEEVLDLILNFQPVQSILPVGEAKP